jgi:gamma-glutamylcyclotransferase (GGCT)/AIG2-like uncharacterized protein YtfP
MNKIQINAETPYVDIAVYGTLRKDCSNHHYLENKSQFLGQTLTEPLFKMYNTGHFPILTNGDQRIVVEIYRISSQRILDSVNRLEGCSGYENNPDDWYKIRRISTELGDAYIYVQPEYTGPESQLIKSNDWNNRSLTYKNLKNVL